MSETAPETAPETASEPESALHTGSGAGSDPEPAVDLNALLLGDPGASVLLRVCGPSMEGAGIRDGALLLVERGAAAVSGQIVVAHLAGGFTVKRLIRQGAQRRLEAAHPAYPSLPLMDGDQLWGVVRHVIQEL